MDYIDLDKPLYAKDKDTGNVHPVVGISYPGHTPSGKDIAICVEDCCEWRANDEIELLPQNCCHEINKNKTVTKNRDLALENERLKKDCEFLKNRLDSNICEIRFEIRDIKEKMTSDSA